MKNILFMLDRIPLTKAMQITIQSLTSDCAELAAPLEPNRNHQGTAFGGSLYSMAALTAWTLLEKTLERESIGYIVVQDSQVEYLKPVTAHFSSHAEWPSPAEKQKFLEGYQRKGLARTEVEVEILCQGQICMRLRGRFVAAKPA